MKKKKLFVKIIFVALIGLLLVSLVAPALFSQSLSQPRKEMLLNGLKVLMWSDEKADKVTVSVRIHAGSAFDPQGKEGLMQVLADNVFPNESQKEFFKDDLGGSLEIVTNYDFIQINASSKPDGFLTMLETLSTAVSNPTIDKETTARLKIALITKVKTLENDPGYVADQAVAKRLFGTFPYGRPQLGTEASLNAIDFADLLDAKARFLTADNATLAITGNFDKALAFRAVRRYFGSWLKSDKRVPSTFRQPDDPIGAVQTIVSPKAGVSAIRMAIRGVARSDKDLAAAMVFSNILESRLNARAAPASVFVRNDVHSLPGSVTIGFSASKNDFGSGNGKVDALDLLTKTLAEPITDSEVQVAKAVVQPAWSRRDQVAIWLDAETFKLSDANADARIFDNISPADVRSFAERIRRSPKASVVAMSAN